MSIRSGHRIATGTGASRRRLTLEEAEAGGLPEPMTRDEWDEMYRFCRAYHNKLIAASCDAVPRPVYLED